MDGKPNQEFGRRRPVVIPPAAPVKRSGHVALLLMGTLAVGGGAYALMPRENCQPASPDTTAPATALSGAGCASRGTSSGGHGGWSGGWSRSNFFSGDSSASSRGSPSSDSGSVGVTRGGFGSFARAFAGHFSMGS